MRVCHSPELIAAYHGLHRLCVPRHPPHTLVRLTLSQSVKQSTRYIERVMRRYRAPSLAAKRIGVTTLSLVFVSVNRPTRPEGRARRSTSRSLPPSVVNQQQSNSRSGMCRAGDKSGTFGPILRRGRPTRRSGKEVIQPQVPLRLPCYDFAPVTALAFGGLVPCGFRHRLRALTASMA